MGDYHSTFQQHSYSNAESCGMADADNYPFEIAWIPKLSRFGTREDARCSTEGHVHGGCCELPAWRSAHSRGNGRCLVRFVGGNNDTWTRGTHVHREFTSLSSSGLSRYNTTAKIGGRGVSFWGPLLQNIHPGLTCTVCFALFPDDERR
jgi:hypothetical protein